MSKGKLVAGGFVIVIALVFLVYKGCTLSVPYYTIGNLISQGDSIHSRTVRVTGVIVPDSLEQGSSCTRFTLTDGRLSMPVKYEGAIPNTLEEGKKVTVEGVYISQGIFKASTILTKCPSRYVPNREAEKK